MNPYRLFVTGTDTGVGKTVVAAALVQRLRAHGPVRYWKPVQTGIEDDDDTRTVACLAQTTAREVFSAGVRLPRPLSPHLAARLAGATIRIDDLVALASIQPAGERWVIEGAGGVLVPLSDRESTIDLIAALGGAVVVVVADRLGAINHTLLTLAALRSRSVPIAGVVMVGGPHLGNREAIETLGGVGIIGTLPRIEPLSPEALSAAAAAWRVPA